MKFNVKRYFQVLGVSLAVILCVGALCLGCDFSAMLDNFRNNSGVSDGVVEEANDGKINVLMMCVDMDGLRTDAIMLAQYDSEQNKVSIMSIPRDTRVFIGNRYQKINAAHAYLYEDGEIGGPEATCGAVSRLTGVPINYYVDFSFDAVAQIINDLGPVNFDIPDIHGDGQGMVYDDPVQGLHINIPPGNHDLNGSQVVQVLRYRKNNRGMGYIDGDMGRIRLQQDFIKALVDQKLNASIILKIPAIFKNVTKNIKTNVSVSDVVKYSKYLTSISSVNINTMTLPGVDAYDTSEKQSVMVPNMVELRTMVWENFGYDGENMTVEDPERQSQLFGDEYEEYYNKVSTGEVNSLGHGEYYNQNLRYGDAYYDSEYDS